MILVDIYVPSVDKVYDFQLNEHTPISAVIEELSEMIGQKERSPLYGNASELMLCDKSSGRIMHKSDTLSSAGITTGRTLILV